MEKEKSLLSGGERPATKGKGSCVLLLYSRHAGLFFFCFFFKCIYLFFYSFTLLKLFLSCSSACALGRLYLSDAMTLKRARRFSTFAV